MKKPEAADVVHEDWTVTVTPNDPVGMEPKTGLESGPKAGEIRTSADNTNLIDIASLSTHSWNWSANYIRNFTVEFTSQLSFANWQAPARNSDGLNERASVNRNDKRLRVLTGIV